MKLNDFLSNIKRNLWSFADRTYNANELSSEVNHCRHFLSTLGGNYSRVSLEITDTKNALIWMFALEGVADTVFLVPQSLLHSDDFQVLKNRFDSSMTIDDAFLLRKNTVSTFSNDSEFANRTASTTSWVLATSGTTGTPKLIEHSTESLTKTCKLDPERGRNYRWGLVYDPFRFAGLQVVLQAIASGSLLVFTNEFNNISEQARFLREQEINSLSATPTFWRKLLMSGEFEGHPLKQITLGGESADQTVLNALRKAFPSARVTHIYASTEAGVGFSVTDGNAGFPIDYLVNGTGKNQVVISNTGKLLIKPEVNTGTTLNGQSLLDANGFIDTGDLVETRGDRVYFLGRDSGTINVGGNKVIPEEIESVIRAIQGVVEVVVKPRTSAVMGQLVTAEIVAAKHITDLKFLKKTIIIHCRENLENFKVPALIKFVDEISSNPSGKISRK